MNFSPFDFDFGFCKSFDFDSSMSDFEATEMQFMPEPSDFALT